MSFEANEISNQDGNVISLYEFMWGGTYWRYTSSDQDIELDQGSGLVTYTAIAISDDGMVQGGSANNDLKVSIQNDVPLVDLFRSTPPAQSIYLTIRRRHQSDANTSFFVYWIGVISNVKKAGVATADVLGQTLLSTFRRSGLRLCWTRGCPHMLYDTECKVDPAAHAVAASITALGAGTITVSTAGGNPIGHFDGGYIEWTATVEGTLDQRSIESSLTATQFQIFGGTDRLTIGQSVTLYPGCDLTAETCDGKFANLPNFGGFEQMSGDNPFDGKNVF